MNLLLKIWLKSVKVPPQTLSVGSQTADRLASLLASYHDRLAPVERSDFALNPEGAPGREIYLNQCPGRELPREATTR